jgi:hypothetical protein
MQGATITFGDVAENGPGMEKIGEMAREGLMLPDLLGAKELFEACGCRCEVLDLVSEGRVEEACHGENAHQAQLLVIRGGVDALLAPAGAAALAAEQGALTPDTKALMRGKVKNKLARHNLCFADFRQDPDYEEGRGTVVDFAALPHLARVRAALPAFFGPKAENLPAEGNYYYDLSKCGIGFHGDAERRVVIALRIGAGFPLHYQWYLRHRPIGKRIAVDLGPGDMYAMSQKAVGTDWRKSSIPTLRHAAGAQKYLA